MSNGPMDEWRAIQVSGAAKLSYPAGADSAVGIALLGVDPIIEGRKCIQWNISELNLPL